MGAVELHQFSSSQGLAETAAGDCLSLIGQHAGEARPFILALSGGRIAGSFFSALAGQATARQVALVHVHFFWSDERCVPPDDPESNFRLANETLLRPLKIPPAQIHRIEGEKPSELSFAAAQARLLELAPASIGAQPTLQLVLLGMGEDGHVASLFPGESDQARASTKLFRCVIASKPPPQRVTMGLPLIVSAQNVWVLASGPGKAQALRDSLLEQSQTPLAQVIQRRGLTRIYSDIPESTGG